MRVPIVFKEPVYEIHDLPIINNAYGDARTVLANGYQYYWSKCTPNGNLIDWVILNGPDIIGPVTDLTIGSIP